MAVGLVKHEDYADRGPSPRLWAKCQRAAIKNDFNLGYYWEDDFVDLPTGKYTATQATAGTFALDDAEGGVALADCNSSTSTQGINVQLGGTAGEVFKPEAGKTIFFEARIKLADIATGPEFFLGLSETDTSIIASSANSSANHIGFESVSDDNVVLFHGEKAGTRGSLTTVHTFVDDAWVKLGFIVYGVTKVEVYVNDVLFGTTLATANIPIVEMRPSLVCQSAGTTDPIAHIDWGMCYAQYGSP